VNNFARTTESFFDELQKISISDELVNRTLARRLVNAANRVPFTPGNLESTVRSLKAVQDADTIDEAVRQTQKSPIFADPKLQRNIKLTFGRQDRLGHSFPRKVRDLASTIGHVADYGGITRPEMNQFTADNLLKTKALNHPKLLAVRSMFGKVFR
jgi:hypothetical protein